MLFNCGGILTLDQLETVVRTLFPKLHELDKQKTGQAVPSALTTGTPYDKEIYDCDATLASWRAKQKIAGVRKGRGFLGQPSMSEGPKAAFMGLTVIPARTHLRRTRTAPLVSRFDTGEDTLAVRRARIQGRRRPCLRISLITGHVQCQ